MKICFVNPTRLQREIYLIAHGLAQRGHRVTVLQPSGAICKYPAWPHVGVLPIPCNYVPEVRYTLPSLRAEYRLLEYLVRREQYELILVQDYQYVTALPPILLRRRYGVPITLVNNALVGVGWQYGKWLFDQVAWGYTHSLGRVIMQSYDRLVFLHQQLAAQTQALLGGAMPPHEVIPFGVELARFSRVDASAKREELGIQAGEKVLVFAGRLVVVKRVEWIVALVRQLREEGLPVRAVIAGGGRWGNPATELAYRELTRPLGDAVRFVGPQSHDALRTLYSLADVVVLPSRSEGWPAVLMEAAACGVPCVASDVGGVREMVQHGETGFVFPPADFAAFVHFVRLLLQDEPMAQRMGAQARTRVEAFDWAKIINRYEELFAHLIGMA